ncbi:ABC transporter ATP-binding protein [Candidatus Viridilinea mediisalina]|uniref:ABC transporter ATP-binding protein n=1 Tax=Candidatus Viridilinea mediisalina TaxID=2024553 RepID=A0A2A6RFV4_9CHLR|nr:ABC transporter ATP-binding protein [Candidatus Viridilinea mediisalina]PDW01766.1 ABC transporter ATP-binding protein [Candidatus Viridilinea mediisalina]
MSEIHEPLIRLEQVSRSYEEAGRTRVVLHELSLSIAAGELVVLVGKSGSGKSTLLNLVSGIDLPSSGEVWVAGRALGRMSEHERTLLRRHAVGFVFQFFNLVPTLTVLENLLLPLELNGRTGNAAQTQAQAMLAAVGLAERGDSYPDRLSGGEQQRVAIARALVHDPALILADEPTGNLDAETGGYVLDLLERLVRTSGKTLLMVTHSAEVVGRADRVLRLREGRVLLETI